MSNGSHRGAGGPECVFANVSLWNRYMQPYDHRDYPISLNKLQTQAGPDGAFRIVVAHEDSVVPNWLATEGRRSGILHWRYQLPETPPEQPVYRVVKLREVSS